MSARWDEVVEALDPGADPVAPSLFRDQIESLLARAEGALSRLARTSDANKAEIDEAREAHAQAQAAVAPARALFDLVIAQRAKACTLPQRFDEATLLKEAAAEEVRTAIRNLQPVHFPGDFPEVVLRDNPGFDCLLGNPPWEKVKVERQVWWGQYLPGIRSLGVSAMNAKIDRLEKERSDLAAEYERAHADSERRKALIRVAFPNIGAGDTDLYQAFSWRNWQLAHRNDGHIGLVLPRTALVGPGNGAWRQQVLEAAGFDVTVLVNNAGWVFDDVHQQYQIALVIIDRAAIEERTVTLLGPHRSLSDYIRAIRQEPIRVPAEEFKSWTPSAAFPMLPSSDALQVFLKLRAHPRLAQRAIQSSSGLRAQGSGLRAQGSGLRAQFRPVAELHSTADRHRFMGDDGKSALFANSTQRTTDTGLSETMEPAP